MRLVQKVCIAVVLLFCGFGRAEDASSKWKFRTVTVQVLDPKGNPAPGVTVSLVGLERDAVYQINVDRNAGKWQFVTDAKGVFTARFGNFRSYDYEQATKKWVPGWGAFYFIAERKGTAGGISPYLQNEGGEYQALSSLPRDEYDEWRTGEFAPVDLSKQPARVVIQLKRGITVFGKVTDPEGNPLPGQGIRIFHNLYAWSHTGHGAETRFASGVTDRKGRYRIDHVYPNRFYLALEESGTLFWFKTRLRNGPWVEGRVDEVQPAKGEKEVQVDLIAAKEAPYRYFGKVTDLQGRGIPHAKVTLGVSLHWPQRTHEDSHHFESAETGDDGVYSIRVESPYIRGFRIEASGFAPAEQWDDDSSKAFAPGAYDFQLKKKE